jgi:hypothetical protein
MRGRALGALLLAAVAGGCSRGETPTVGRIQIAAGAQEEAIRAAGLDRDALREATRASLQDAGFRVTDGEAAYHARLEVISAQGAPLASGALEIAVELQLYGEGAGAVRSLAEEGVGRARGRGAEAWREAYTAAARDAAAGLVLALRAEGKKTDALLRDLGASDARVREQAIRVLGDRHSPEAVVALIAELKDPDLALAERAAGALAQIGDRRAVGPIIDFTQRLEDGPYSARYARLIGDLGGSEARGYLLTLESGHPDPRIREAAHGAREEMEAREREATATRSASRDSGRMKR